MRNSKLKPAALLWDESYLWGIMAHKALAASGFAFDLIRSGDVRNGVLSDYALLFVPGGWASNKMKALGDGGVEAIKGFVRDGGAYVGFCGGAGLATMDGIGLLPVKRRPTKERVPSFSGPIMLDTADHPLWEDITEPVFHAWWPSQFLADKSVSVLASYGEAMPGSFSSDINVRDAEAAGSWLELEKTYGINLDPKRLLREPAVIEGRFGEGKVLLSLVHFDTPGDRNGAVVLRNIGKYLGAGMMQDAGSIIHHKEQPASRAVRRKTASAPEAAMMSIESAVVDLIDLGQRNFLWYWRSPMLLQWRRGVRGLEYCTLFVMVSEIAELFGRLKGDQRTEEIGQGLERLSGALHSFNGKAKDLLVRERFAMQNSNITYERCDDPEIQRLREELFSLSKSHGGLFKVLADEMDSLLFRLLRECRSGR